MADETVVAEVPEEDAVIVEGPAVDSEFDSRITAIEAEVDSVLSTFVDNGDGTYGHLLNVQHALGGLRDAQRAWQHIINRPDSALEAERKAAANA